MFIVTKVCHDHAFGYLNLRSNQVNAIFLEFFHLANRMTMNALM